MDIKKNKMKIKLTTDQLQSVAKRFNLHGVNIPVAFREIEKMTIEIKDIDCRTCANFYGGETWESKNECANHKPCNGGDKYEETMTIKLWIKS